MIKRPTHECQARSTSHTARTGPCERRSIDQQETQKEAIRPSLSAGGPELFRQEDIHAINCHTDVS